MLDSDVFLSVKVRSILIILETPILFMMTFSRSGSVTFKPSLESNACRPSKKNWNFMISTVGSSHQRFPRFLQRKGRVFFQGLKYRVLFWRNSRFRLKLLHLLLVIVVHDSPLIGLISISIQSPFFNFNLFIIGRSMINPKLPPIVIILLDILILYHYKKI